MTVQRHLVQGARRLDAAVGHLSSGQRIQSAGDNGAGVAMRDNMRGQRDGMRQAMRNAHDAVALLQVAESGLEQIGELLRPHARARGPGGVRYVIGH